MLKASSAVRTYHSYFLRGENRDQRNALGKPLESFVFNCNEDGDYRPFLLPMCTRNNGLIRGEVFLEVIPSVQHSSEYHGTSHSAASPFFSILQPVRLFVSSYPRSSVHYHNNDVS